MSEFNSAALRGIRDLIAGNPYRPGAQPCEANADILDGYAYGWDEATRESYAHDVVIKRDGGHGYPYRAHCDCGWKSNTYAAAHAAWDMADDHVEEQAIAPHRTADVPAFGRTGVRNVRMRVRNRQHRIVKMIEPGPK